MFQPKDGVWIGFLTIEFSQYGACSLIVLLFSPVFNIEIRK